MRSGHLPVLRCLRLPTGHASKSLLRLQVQPFRHRGWRNVIAAGGPGGRRPVPVLRPRGLSVAR